MACCELHYFSKALGKATAADVILPEAEVSGPFAVFYLLHGLSDDHTIWRRRTSIERYVQHLPLIVVMPDGGRGFYCDAAEGYAYETALAQELVQYIDSRFQTIPTREKRCIGGLSMGGYGAVKLAVKYPELFCSANSHSGAVAWAHWPPSAQLEPQLAAEWKRIRGEGYIGGPNDTFALADRLPSGDRPALRIDCGVDDFLIESNRLFHQHLVELRYPHEYEEFEGEHNWAYWDLHVQEAVAFHARNMGLTNG